MFSNLNMILLFISQFLHIYLLDKERNIYNEGDQAFQCGETL